MLALEITLGKVILIVAIIGSFLIYMGINSGIFFQEAEGAYYCSKTCRDKLKAEEDKVNQTSTVTKPKAEPCYGIYCNKKPQEKDTPKNSNQTVKAEPCYGIHCDDKPDQDPAQTKILPTSPTSQLVPLGRNFISLRLSTSCEDIDYCPNIKDLADKFDNSNRYLSGDFLFDNKTNKWVREKPKLPNVFEIYRYTDVPWVLWVNPDDYTWDRSKQITIEPHLYYIGKDRQIDDTRMRYEYQDLWVQGCSKASIGWKNKHDNNETSGQGILLDVLNYFYSNCRERIVTDPTIEIFMGSDIFADCDKACLFYKERFKLELKAEALVSKQLAKSGLEEEVVKKAEPCYGIYCDKKEELTVEEKITEQEQKEKIRQERLKELEDINECAKWQRYDPDIKRAEKVNCNDKIPRVDYIAVMRAEYPEGVETVQKYR